jgi:hypothetical protein
VKALVVALVRVAGEDVVHEGPDHLQEAMLRAVRVAGVEGFGERSRLPDALVELADGEQPGVVGQLAGRRLDDGGGRRRDPGLAARRLVYSSSAPQLRDDPGAPRG